ncbi:MAG: AMP-binding protein, partial [Xanthomonadales bacterium]|nr:AMP-binding protein [Xanthomonadales bacterium]
KPLPGVRRVLSAGAPVPSDVVATMRELLPEDGEIWTPYGATECLPVAVIEGRELQQTRAATNAGAGTCVGRPVPPNEVRIIAIDDRPISAWSDELLTAAGTVGEITVAGPTATDAYYNRDAATAIAKIPERLADGSVRVIHRMGDIGYFDEQGRLWFCGRKSQRVESASGPLYAEQVEPVFNTHPEVRRTALVGVGEFGNAEPVICVELIDGVSTSKWPVIEAGLRELAGRHPHCSAVQRFLRHPGFPVDIRHNAKIGREQLARWAAKQLERVTT